MGDDYTPAERPPGDIAGGDRVRFEREGGEEVSLFGQTSSDIANLIMRQTVINHTFIGRTIHSSQAVNDTISGKLIELQMQFTDGHRIAIKCGDDNNLVIEILA